MYAIKNIKYRNINDTSKEGQMCKIKFWISDLLTLIETCGLSSYFLGYLVKSCQSIKLRVFVITIKSVILNR